MEPDVQWFMGLADQLRSQGLTAEITATVEEGKIVGATVKLELKPGDPLPGMEKSESSALTV